jgi:hypothetical protein
VEDGFHAATTDETRFGQWLRRWPRALIGVPTGPVTAVVLDVDIKRSNANGFDTLAELGQAILPDTPLVHTVSGGLHVYFDPGDREFRNTEGKRGRGLGLGLDVRGTGGYVVVPSPGSGYAWDPIWNLDSAPLAPAPDWLVAPEPEQVRASGRSARPSEDGLSPYGEAAVDAACRLIIEAPDGEQEATFNGQAFAIGTLVGAGGLPAGFARRALLWAARQVRSYDARRPWRPVDIEHKIERAFDQGMRQPREMRRG